MTNEQLKFGYMVAITTRANSHAQHDKETVQVQYETPPKANYGWIMPGSYRCPSHQADVQCTPSQSTCRSTS